MIRKRKERKVEMQLGSFSDIAFLLIIFFVLTTTFVKNSGTNMKIPSAESSDAPAEAEESMPTISLLGSEIMYSEGDNKQNVSMNELREILKKADFPNKADDKRLVILDSSPDVNYQRYYSVVNAIDDAGAVMALLADEGGGKK